MTELRREWTVVEDPEHAAAEVFAHVVSRAGTAIRTGCERYDGVRLHTGNAVFGAAHRSHLVSLACGRDAATGRVALRLQVLSNRGAVRALVVFPVVLLASLVASARWGGSQALVGGLVFGSVLGAAASYGAFLWTTRRGSRAVGGRTTALAIELERRVEEAIGALGLQLARAEVTLIGIDTPDGEPDADWDRALRSATAGLAG